MNSEYTDNLFLYIKKCFVLFLLTLSELHFSPNKTTATISVSKKYCI